eukprot:6207164-Pleurochrysis_carterae.AAC.1
MSVSVSPVSVQLQMSPDGGVPRVVLKLKHPSPAIPNDGAVCMGTESSSSLSQSEVDGLKRELANSKAAVTQLRSSLRNALLDQRMLGAQSRESLRSFRKQMAGMRASCWHEIEKLRQEEKQTERDLRQL